MREGGVLCLAAVGKPDTQMGVQNTQGAVLTHTSVLRHSEDIMRGLQSWSAGLEGYREEGRDGGRERETERETGRRGDRDKGRGRESRSERVSCF